jgi:hypothetical protein
MSWVSVSYSTRVQHVVRDTKTEFRAFGSNILPQSLTPRKEHTAVRLLGHMTMIFKPEIIIIMTAALVCEQTIPNERPALVGEVPIF